jgi:hypothetical protein
MFAPESHVRESKKVDTIIENSKNEGRSASKRITMRKQTNRYSNNESLYYMTLEEQDLMQ